MSEEENIEQSADDSPQSTEKENVSEPSTINDQPSTNMEVHHSHHLTHKKKWTEYVLEFFMLFLAVTLGFFAESIREHITDNSKEKEYIISMIEDAQTDTANIIHAIALNNTRISHLDSLALLCINYDAAKNEDAAMYKHFLFGLIHPSFISPTERTIQQLKNAGGMRLIRKKTAVDSIILYDDMAKKLADQQAYYELYQNKTVDIAVQVFNFQRLGVGVSSSVMKNFSATDSTVKLIMNNKIKLSEFANLILIYEGVVHFYNILLQQMNEHAVRLIKTLQKEYHLE